MDERDVVRFLAIGAAVLIASLVGWFLVRVRPRSIAYRVSGATLVALVVGATALVVPPLVEAMRAHAEVDSEGGTFFFGMLAELFLLAAALVVIGGASLWRFGIRRHPGPVPRGERVAQSAALFVSLGYTALQLLRCAAPMARSIGSPESN